MFAFELGPMSVAVLNQIVSPGFILRSWFLDLTIFEIEF